MRLCNLKKVIQRDGGYGTETETFMLKKRNLAVTGWSREMHPTIKRTCVCSGKEQYTLTPASRPSWRSRRSTWRLIGQAVTLSISGLSSPGVPLMHTSVWTAVPFRRGFLCGTLRLYERDSARNVARSSLPVPYHRHRYRLADD